MVIKEVTITSSIQNISLKIKNAIFNIKYIMERFGIYTYSLYAATTKNITIS